MLKPYLAENANINEFVQEMLINDISKDSDIIKRNLAKNPCITISIQRKLVLEDKFVRMYLAENPSIALEIQLALCDKIDFAVFQTLIENPSLNKKTYKKLTQCGIRIKYV